MKIAKIVHGANASWDQLFKLVGKQKFEDKHAKAKSLKIRVGMGQQGPEAVIDDLYQFIIVLRNNVFHGSKGDRQDDNDRNKELIELGIDILIQTLTFIKQSDEQKLKEFTINFYP